MMWQFAVCAVQFVFMITHLCNICQLRYLSVVLCVFVRMDGRTGGGMNGERMSFIYVLEDCGIPYITKMHDRHFI